MSMNYIKENFDITLGRDDKYYFINVSINDPVLEYQGVKTIKETDLNLFKEKVNNFLIYYLEKKLYNLT